MLRVGKHAFPIQAIAKRVRPYNWFDEPVAQTSRRLVYSHQLFGCQQYNMELSICQGRIANFKVLIEATAREPLEGRNTGPSWVICVWWVVPGKILAAVIT